MKRIAFIVLVLVLWLATWKGGASPKALVPDRIPMQTNASVMETTFLPTPTGSLVP